MQGQNPEIILLFDGVCNLCNGVVRWLVPRDPEARIAYVSLQSDLGRMLLERFQLPTEDFTSIVVISGGRAYVKSDAVLQVVLHLKGGWRCLRFLRMLPKRWRDALYTWVANHRYRWFGQMDSCFAPTPDLKRRFPTAWESWMG